jgi:hypothetical protein
LIAFVPFDRGRADRLQRIVLGLDPSALEGPVENGGALRDEVGYAGRLGCGQQVIRSLGAQPVGDGEEAVGLPQVGLAGVRLGKARHLIHDRVWPGRSHRLAPTETASSPSITTPSAPSRAREPSLAALVVVAVTWWPRATSCGTSRCPMTAVPPATNTRMTVTFLIPGN